MSAFRKIGIITAAISLMSTLPLLAETEGENAGFLTPKLINPTSSAPGRSLSSQAPVRKIAANPRNSSVRMRANRDYRNSNSTETRLSISGGTSGLSSGNSLIQRDRDTYKIGSNIIAGIAVDVRFAKYFGVELDTFYGFSGTNNLQDETTQQDIGKKKIQALGGMLGVKAHYPTYIGSAKLIPKIGLGYGTFSLKEHSESTQPTTVTADFSQSYKGIYGAVGFDIEPVSWMIISADYARSLSSSGSFSGTSNVGNQELELEQTSFDRIRAGALFRVAPQVFIGGDYIRRTLNYSETQVVGGPIGSQLDLSSQESLNQIAAKILFKF